MTTKTLLTTAIAATIAASALTADAERANATEFNDRSLTAVWVNIKAFRGEGLWQACRRVYQHDVYQVRHGEFGQVRCKIDHSRIYDYGERYQNFN
jgi:hypothetical protein